MNYNASLDFSATSITVIVLSLFLILSVGLLRKAFVYYRNRQYFISSVLVFIVISMVFLAVLGYGINASSYKVIDRNITIVTPFNEITIKKENILSVSVMKQEELVGLSRTRGINGFWGYYGWYKSSTLENLFFYATQKKNYILIQTKDNYRFVITPDNIELIDNFN